MAMINRRLDMKLGRRPKRKQDQALDVVASAAKTWSEWQLAKRAGKGVRKGAKKAAALKSGKPSGLKGAVTGTPGKITGVVALVGGLGAMVARKLKDGGDAEPSYSPPAPHEPAAAPPPAPSPTAAAIVHDAPPPPSLSAAPPPPPMAKPDTSVKVEDLATDGEPATATAEPDSGDDSEGEGSESESDDSKEKDEQ
jgi:hypothetical protein